MPPCLRVSSPEIGVCSRLAISSTLYLPNNKFVSICCTLPPSQSLKSTQRVARTLIHSLPLKHRPRQHNLPSILPNSQHIKPARKFVASTRPWYCRLPPYKNTIALKQRSITFPPPFPSLASFTVTDSTRSHPSF